MPTLPSIPLPESHWWSDRGLAVVLVGVALVTALFCLREWWRVHRPYKLKLLELSVAKEEKQCRLYDTLSEVVPQQHALLERIDERQESHARACVEGEKAAQKNGDILRQIANKVLSQ